MGRARTARGAMVVGWAAAGIAVAVALVSWVAAGADPVWADGEAPAAPSGEAKGEASGAASLDWLAGTWRGAAWGGDFRATYAVQADGVVLSFSELYHGGKPVYYEFEVFRREAGTLRLTPYPEGKPASSFRLTAADPKARRAVFECPENDFPTRIVYQRVADDRLVITLSAPHHGSDKVEVFDLRREAPAPAPATPAADQDDRGE